MVLDRIFLQVLNMSYTAGYVILFILLARLVLRKAPKRFTFALWSVALFRLICPWSFESMFSLLVIGGRAAKQYHPFPEQHMTLETVRNSIAINRTGVVSSNIANMPAVSNVPPEPLLDNIFTLLWLTGIAVLLIYSVTMLFRLKKQLKDSVHDTGNVYLSEHLSTPFVMGVIRPKIYLPKSLSETEKRYILLHERTHIRQFDHVVKPVSFFVLCIHWFNPLVWLAFFLSGRDMEMACDEAVIRKLGNDVKKEYSASLLSLSTGRPIVGGSPLAFGEGDAKSRIKNILSYKKPAFWVMAISLIIIIAICAGLALNPKPADEHLGYADKLWQHRTAYLGDNSAVGNIINLLKFPEGIVCDGFELHTTQRPYMLTVNLKTDTQTRNFNTGTLNEKPFQINACILFSLIENVEYITFSLDDGVYDPYFMQYTADWSESIVGADLWEESKTLHKFEALLVRINDHVHSAIGSIEDATPAQQGGLTFWVKPDESDVVMGETAAILWLKSYMEESTPPTQRIVDYEINGVTVISGTPPRGRARQDMEYHYLVRIDYDITTALDEYFAPGDGVSGKGTFEGLFRELCIKDLGGGNFDVVSIGTGGGVPEFAVPLEVALTKAILEQEINFYSDSDFICESHITLATEAAGPADNGDKIETITVYAMVLIQRYNYTDNGLSEVGGSHIPTAITFDVDESGKYTLKEYWIPRDGSYYAPDIRAKFPSGIWQDALDTQKYILAQIQNCYAQAIGHKGLDIAPIIEKLFETIMSSPAASSNVGDYIKAHRLVYRELTYYGDYTLRYIFSEFLKGGQTGLKGHLMRAVMDDLIGDEKIPMTADNGQEYFDAWREHGEQKLLSLGEDAMREDYPKSYLMLTMLSGI